MNASKVGSSDWWLVIQSMPPSEALQHLNDFRASLVRHNQGTPEYIAAAKDLIKVNAEIKRFNLMLDNGRWYNACRNVLPPEQFDAVLAEKRILEGLK